jgi:hypothetical protein
MQEEAQTVRGYDVITAAGNEADSSVLSLPVSVSTMLEHRNFARYVQIMGSISNTGLNNPGSGIHKGPCTVKNHPRLGQHIVETRGVIGREDGEG